MLFPRAQNILGCVDVRFLGRHERPNRARRLDNYTFNNNIEPRFHTALGLFSRDRVYAGHHDENDPVMWL